MGVHQVCRRLGCPGLDGVPVQHVAVGASSAGAATTGAHRHPGLCRSPLQRGSLADCRPRGCLTLRQAACYGAVLNGVDSTVSFSALPAAAFASPAARAASLAVVSSR